MRRPMALWILAFCLGWLGWTPRVMAAAPTLILPPHGAWVLGAENIAAGARSLDPLVQSLGKRIPDWGPGRLDQRLSVEFGAHLLDPAQAEKQGLDPAAPWQLFSWKGGTWALVGVRNRDMLDASIQTWAGQRLLRQREQRTGPHGVVVGFSRQRGSREAAGYALWGKKAVILASPGSDGATLEQAVAALAASQRTTSPVDAPLALWTRDLGPFGETWTGLRPQPGGLDLSGWSRRPAGGFWTRDDTQSAWITALTAAGGNGWDAPIRLRLSGGPRAGTVLADTLDSATWGPTALRFLESVSGGATEAFLRPPDWEADRGRGLAVDLLAMLSPGVTLWNRAPSTLAPLSQPSGTAASWKGIPLNLRKEGKQATLFVGSRQGSPADPTSSPGGGVSACRKGAPVGSLRIDAAALAQGLGRGSLWGALSGGDATAALYAINLQFGPLLRASQPITALACLEDSGGVRWQATWRIQARQ